MSWFENAINNQVRNSAELSQTNNVKQTAKNQVARIPVGQVFKGEVTDISNKNITIRLENGQTVQAKLQGDFQFSLGESISFEVKSNNGALIEIRPVINAENGADLTALKALKAAGLPVNERTIMLLKNLMQEQMPIDKASLMKMYKLAVTNNSADVSTIVKMFKLDIPITPENISQFENYRGFQHQISNQAADIAEELPQILGEISKEENVNVNQFHMQLLSLIKTDEAPDKSQNPLLNADLAGNQVIINKTEERQDLPKPFLEGFIDTEGQTEEESVSVNIKNNEMPVKEDEVPANINDAKLNQLLGRAELDSVANALKEAGIDKNQINLIREGNISVNDFLSAVKQFAGRGENLHQLMRNPAYHKILSNILEDNFLLKPNDVLEKGSIEQYYSRIREQSNQITHMLELVGKESSVCSKQASGVSENVDFMNQLNHMFSYVQLPLKMANESAHGDLYVFTNKKSLRENKDKVSALLHLDMISLGSMDIYVELEKSFVKTNFYLEDKEKLEFMQSNIELLVSRLNERGYSVSTDFNINETKKELFDDFISEKHQIPMQRFSFDVKA